jgi:hypothetical protein
VLGGLWFSEGATSYFERKYDIPCLSLRVWKVKLEGESIWGVCSFDRKKEKFLEKGNFFIRKEYLINMMQEIFGSRRIKHAGIWMS